MKCKLSMAIGIALMLTVGTNVIAFAFADKALALNPLDEHLNPLDEHLNPLNRRPPDCRDRPCE